MWLTEHSIETTVSPEAIWQQWADVASWPEWNADIERIELDGPFGRRGRGRLFGRRAASDEACPSSQHRLTKRTSQLAERGGFTPD